MEISLEQYNKMAERLTELEYRLAEQPEIIRCKDCTRFDKRRGCNLIDGLNIAKPDSFCSYAVGKGEQP